MKRIRAPTLPTAERRAELPETEAHHAVQVLRLRDGESVLALDGRGAAVIARLRVRGRAVELEFERDAGIAADDRAIVPLTLELAVLKGDAMEWAIEKCVELGAARLAPLTTAHTVVQLDRKGPEEFRQRWQRIADQALKQCGRLRSLEMLAPRSLEQTLAAPLPPGAERLWCDDQGRSRAQSLWDRLAGEPADRHRHVVVGPEGGFSDRERELLARSAHAVSLGPLTLRAETAALQVAAVIAARYRGQLA
jgi:16S rRNA (uracil1498-N3)-methyltransferase